MQTIAAEFCGFFNKDRSGPEPGAPGRSGEPRRASTDDSEIVIVDCHATNHKIRWN
jgi:hypothetical protein